MEFTVQKSVTFRNPLISPRCKPLFSLVKTDSLCPSKIKSNGDWIAVPDVNGIALGILPLPKELSHSDPIKLRDHAPLTFGTPDLLTVVHGKPIQEFEFSATDNLIASSSRTDSLVRLWKLPDQIQLDNAVELDAPLTFLAGHEKRIDHIRFHAMHPHIVATASQDRTIKLWDVDTLQDRISLELANDVFAQSIAFDSCYDFVLAALSDGTIQLFDPRTGAAPVHSRMSNHTPTKGFRIAPINPYPLMVSCGFDKEGARNLGLFDFRMALEIENYKIRDMGPSMLTPLADPNLPLLYLVGKGEPTRVFEFDSGSIVFNASLKTEKPTSATELIPKTVLDRKKCEIARFISLTNEKLIEINSLCVPRAKTDAPQDDLYPSAVPSLVLPSPDSWFTAQAPSLSGASLNEASRLASVRGDHSTRRKSLLHSRSSSQAVPGHTRAISSQSSTALSDTPALSLHFHEGFLELEIKGWLRNEWQMRWVALKSTKIYTSAKDDLSMTPFLRYEHISKVAAFKSVVDGKPCDTGFQFESGGSLYRWRAESSVDRDEWISKLSECLKETEPSPKHCLKEKKLPVLPKEPKNDGFVLLNMLECAETDSKGAVQWIKRLVCLDLDSMMHFFPSTLLLKDYSPKSLPVESLDLSFAWSVRKTKSGSGSVLTINTAKRAYHLRARSDADVKDWFEQISDLIPELPVKVSIIEGAVSAKIGGLVSASWMVFVNCTLFYHAHQYSTHPVYIVDTGSVKSFGFLVDNYCTNQEPDIISDSSVENISYQSQDNREVRHSFQTKDEFLYWLLCFDQIRRSSWDLVAKLGWQDIDSLERGLAAFKSEEPMEGVVVYNESLVSAGKQKLLFRLHDGVAVALPVEVAALSEEGSFVLDCGADIYHWSGERASRVCRAEGLNLGSSIRKYRGTRPRLHICDAEDPTLVAQFFALLGATSGQVKVNHKRRVSFQTSTFERLCIFSHSMEDPYKLCFAYQGDRPSKGLLQGACIVEMEHEVFCWIGKAASNEQRLCIRFFAKKLAESLKQKYKFVFYSEEFHGRETPMFKSKFYDYPTDLPISMRIDEKKGNIARDIVQEPIDVAGLLTRKATALPTIPKGGTVRCFRIKSFEKVPIEPKDFGIFSQLESYVISYVYTPPGSGQDKCILFFWQGSRSTIIEKGTSALISIEMAKETGCEVSQIRVLEGKASDDGPICFEVREQFGNARAYEVIPSELHEVRHSLVVLAKRKSFVFVGPQATEREKMGVTWVVETLGTSPSAHPIEEDDVSALLGSACSLQLRDRPRLLPRLFTCSGAAGQVKIEELSPFTQDDLEANMVFLLDTAASIYVWVGSHSRPVEQSVGIKTMMEYLEKANRPADAIYTTYPYQEPVEFTQCFHGWNREKYPKECLALPPKTRLAAVILDELERKEYPKAVLLSDQVPDHVDKTCLELYLSDSEFQETFGLSKAEYQDLQPWKRETRRRQAGFF
ncbi:Coronin-2B [Kappamyces sp. JEL0680]|nr:Coronin-2B [Kappamyces sp. JEL0680]